MSETAASAPPPAAPPKAKTTEYLILVYDEENEAWLEGPVVKARSPRKAIENALESVNAKKDDPSEKFVAVPKRYWVIEEPGVETQTRIVWK